MSTPLTDGINALTQYANETTGKQDTTLSDAVGSLVEGYGGGSELITGQITPTENIRYYVPFGKTLNNYILHIVMTDESIAQLENAGITTYKAYEFLVIRKPTSVGNTSVTNNCVVFRYNGNGATSSVTNAVVAEDDGFEITARDLVNASLAPIYIGYTYNYTIIPLA